MPKILPTLSLLAILTGCSQFPGVYKLDIPQGNLIDQEMVDQLRPGMTQRQVKFIMGTPIIEDTFNADRWDYVYTMKKPDQTPTQSKVSLFFQQGRLSNIKGNYRPSPQPEVAQ
ncbi:MAG: outer membrane protein assembly factor BamE [Pseudomonadales bacterium]